MKNINRITLCGIGSKKEERFLNTAIACGYVVEKSETKADFAVIFSKTANDALSETFPLFQTSEVLHAVALLSPKTSEGFSVIGRTREGWEERFLAKDEREAFAKIIGFFDKTRSEFSFDINKLQSDIANKRKEAAKEYKQVDAAATLYALLNGKMQSVFRVGVTIDEEVDRYLLKVAVLWALKCFPYFAVKLAQGVFTPHFIENDKEIFIFKETPFRAVIDGKRNNGYPFLVSVSGKRICVDIGHYLTDGSGGQIFLNKIVECYRKLSQNQIPQEKQVLPGETEDAALRYNNQSKFAKGEGKLMTGVVSYTEEIGDVCAPQEEDMVFSTSKLLQAARDCHTKLTTFLAAEFLMCMSEGNRQKKKPYSIVIPVNARNLLSSNTMKNFTFFCRVIIDASKPATLENYCKAIDEALERQLTKESLQKKISFSVIAKKSGIVKIIPTFIKRFVCKMNIRYDFCKRQSFVFSNLGKDEHDLDFRFTGLGGPVPYVLNAVSSGETFHLSIVRLARSDKTLQLFKQRMQEYRLS